MPTALFLHHDANSQSGLLKPLIEAEGFEIVEHHICTELGSGIAAGPLPTLDGIELLVVLGSRWSVYDRANVDTWIDAELELVREADRRELPVLGICFGGQLLATAHHGSVRQAPFEEIGWITISPDPSPNNPITDGPWFQWHLDVFDPPPGSQILATSPAGAQAFKLRRNLGLQFHPEVDRAVLEDWMVTDRDQLRDCGIDAQRLLDDTARKTPEARTRAEALVRAFLHSVQD